MEWGHCSLYSLITWKLVQWYSSEWNLIWQGWIAVMKHFKSDLNQYTAMLTVSADIANILSVFTLSSNLTNYSTTAVLYLVHQKEEGGVVICFLYKFVPVESWNILSWNGHMRIIESDSWFQRCPNTPGLGPWPPWGACSSAWPPSQWRTFSWYPMWWNGIKQVVASEIRLCNIHLYE